MFQKISNKLILSALLLIPVNALGLQDEANTPPVVVELFTSQGCSSCPPADKFLAALNDEGDNGKTILPLAFHVDYWDKRGWKDPFSSPLFTGRQENYSFRNNQKSLYTPQIIIDGVYIAAGNDQLKVRKYIKKALEDNHKIPTKIKRLSDNELEITVGSENIGNGDEEMNDMLLITYDKAVETKIISGENRGRSIINTNIVKGVFHIGYWNKGIATGTLPFEKIGESDAVALIIQETNQGKIIGAANLVLK